MKGCGKTTTQPTEALPNTASQSPQEKSEVMSDNTDDSPETTKKEI